MLKLDTEIDLARFFSWWGQQLNTFLPLKFRQALNRNRSLLVIDCFADVAKISHWNGDEQTLLGEFEFNALGKDEVQRLIRNRDEFADVDVVLRVPENLSVKQAIFLPLAAESNLAQVVGYELDRYTPFNQETVYFDFIKQGLVNNQTMIHLVLVLVRKNTLEGLYEQCKELGLTPTIADSATQPIVPGELVSYYNLLPKALSVKTNRIPLFIMLGSLGLLLVLVIIALVLPLKIANDNLDELKKYTRQVEKTALGIEDSKKGIDYLYQATQKVIDKKSASPVMIDLVNAVSKELADDTWVSQLYYSDQVLQLTGQSGSASNLIASLEASKLFKNVKFISPVTKDNRTKLERFKISLEVIQQKNDANVE